MSLRVTPATKSSWKIHKHTQAHTDAITITIISIAATLKYNETMVPDLITVRPRWRRFGDIPASSSVTSRHATAPRWSRVRRTYSIAPKMSDSQWRTPVRAIKLSFPSTFTPVREVPAGVCVCVAVIVVLVVVVATRLPARRRHTTAHKPAAVTNLRLKVNKIIASQALLLAVAVEFIWPRATGDQGRECLQEQSKSPICFGFFRVPTSLLIKFPIVGVRSGRADCTERIYRLIKTKWYES